MKKTKIKESVKLRTKELKNGNKWILFLATDIAHATKLNSFITNCINYYLPQR